MPAESACPAGELVRNQNFHALGISDGLKLGFVFFFQIWNDKS